MSNISYVYGTESDKYNAYTIYRDGRRLEPQPLAEYIEKLESRIVELEAKQRWIPVSERLPEEYEEVLVIFTGFNFDGGLWKKMRVCSIEDWEYIGNPTHWMPLPEPPEDFNDEPA